MLNIGSTIYKTTACARINECRMEENKKKNNNNNNSIVEKLLISHPSVPSLRSVFLSLNPHNNNNNINGFIGGLNRSRHVTITSAAIERPQKSTTILPFSPFPSSGQFARQKLCNRDPADTGKALQRKYPFRPFRWHKIFSDVS